LQKIGSVPIFCIKTIQGYEGQVGAKAVAFSPDGWLIVSVGGSDGLAKIWDISSGSLIRAFKVSDDRFVEIRRFGGLVSGWVAFTPDGKRIIYMGSDASFRIFDAATGEEIVTLIEFDDGEWLAVTAEGYYNASEKGAQYLKVSYEGKDYNVDQFYDVFYRPDIVSAKLTGQDIRELVSITMKDASKNLPPFVEFTTVPADTDRSRVKVCYQMKSAGGGIGEVRLFHNGKLIHSDGYYHEIARSSSKKQLVAMDSKTIYEDMRSIVVKGTAASMPLASKSKGDVFNDCREIEVVPGDNEISVSAFNGNNTVQSSMKTVHFHSKSAHEEPYLYIMAIGIDQYRDKTVNLKYAVKDARDLEQKLKVQSATLYKPENIHPTLLMNRDATKNNILEQVSELAAKVKPQDSFIFFVASHGVLLRNQYYIVSYDFDGKVS